jgi:PAS domain S-box-containing protein
MTNPAFDAKSAELQRFQDALDAAREKGPAAYDALFDAPPDGLSVHEINAEKVLVRVSRAHERLLGYPPHRMTGQPVSSFIILKEVSEMAMNRKLATSGKLETYARAFVKADGTGVTLLQLDRHVLDAGGKVAGIRTVLTLMPAAPPPSGSWTVPQGFPGGAGSGPAKP